MNPHGIIEIYLKSLKLRKRRSVIEELDQGKIRVAEPFEDGWKVNEWIKKAVALFPYTKNETYEAGPLEFRDKIPLKSGYKKRV